MISGRGPENIFVVERTGVPVREVCSRIIKKDTMGEIQSTFLVTKEEIFECINFFCCNFGPRVNDFLEIVCTAVNDDVEIDTVGLSDWVYLSLIELGYENLPDSESIMDLYVKGLEMVMTDCLFDRRNGLDDYKLSDIHALVFESFEEAYGKIDEHEADKLLNLLDFMILDDDNDEDDEDSDEQ
jgi:hypothetical protein